MILKEKSSKYGFCKLRLKFYFLQRFHLALTSGIHTHPQTLLIFYPIQLLHCFHLTVANVCDY